MRRPVIARVVRMAGLSEGGHAKAVPRFGVLAGPHQLPHTGTFDAFAGPAERNAKIGKLLHARPGIADRRQRVFLQGLDLVIQHLGVGSLFLVLFLLCCGLFLGRLAANLPLVVQRPAASL